MCNLPLYEATMKTMFPNLQRLKHMLMTFNLSLNTVFMELCILSTYPPQPER